MLRVVWALVWLVPFLATAAPANVDSLRRSLAIEDPARAAAAATELGKLRVPAAGEALLSPQPDQRRVTAAGLTCSVHLFP